jgi:hypothetical protein
MKTRTEITVETDRWVVVKRHKTTCWCDGCSRPVEMLNVDDAAIVARVNSHTILRWAKSGVLHAAETPQGLLRICLRSLYSVLSALSA